MSRPLLVVCATALLGSTWVAACAATSQNRASAGTGGGGASVSATSSGGASLVTSSGTGAGGVMGIGGGCVGTSSKADPVPLDIFVMLDQSNSMNDDAGNSKTKWQTVEAALTKFVEQPDAAGIGMGIQYFGQPDPTVHGCAQQSCVHDGDCTGGCTSCAQLGVCQSTFNPDTDSCTASDYAWAEVPIQKLPGAAGAIISSIASHQPSTNTPTSPALEGAIDYAKAWADQHPTHITVVALATDGEPSTCDIDLNDIDGIARKGLKGTPSVRTFVIGVGPALTALDGIAAAGGTKAAYHVDLNTMATQEFLGAMNQIRGVALGCTYQIPSPPPGMNLDFAEVNVDFDPHDGTGRKTFPQVADEAHCPANGGAWYYDDPKRPTEIILCGSTCKSVSDLMKGELDVVLGCSTIVG